MTTLPPGDFGLPIIGETLEFFNDPDFSKKRHQKYGPIFKSRLFGKSTIFVFGSEANNFVLTNENKYFIGIFPPSTVALLGPLSLSVQTGSIHQQKRKLLYQAFQPRALAGYVDTMGSIADQYLKKWENMGQLTWYPELRNYTFDVASKLLIGMDNGAETTLCDNFENWCAGLFSLTINLPWTRFGKAMRSRRLLLAELERIIHAKKQEPISDNNALSLLLQAKDEDGNSLSIEEVKDQILLLLFAGHETLTSSIATFCLKLAQHPEIAAKARQEVRQFSDDQPLTIEQLKQMTYLEQVLKEVLRIIPPVGGVFRKVINPCEIQGYQIPKDWNLLCQIRDTHQDNTLYSEPQNFDPDRFAPERAEGSHKPFTYIPFGGGIRECLGKEFARLEMKVFAYKILRNYSWELLPNQDLRMVAAPAPRPRDGLQVKLERIS